MDYAKIVNLLGIIILIVGAIVVLGWIFHIDVLKSGFSGAITMKFGVAISFVCTGVSFLFITRKRGGNAALAQIGLPASTLIIIMLPIVNSISVFLGGNISIAMLFINEPISSFTSTPRPSEGAFVSFILIAAAFILSLSDFARMQNLLIVFGVIIGVIGGAALIGYAISMPILYYYINSVGTAMSIHTAALFVLSGTSLILLGYDKKHAAYLKTIRVKTKLISLFLLTSVIPNFFLAIITYILIRDFETIRPFGYSFAIFATVTSIMVGFFAFFLSKEIVTPIIGLRNAANKIAEGNLDVKANENTSDEIGQLAKTFNDMVDSMKLSTKLETDRLLQIDKDKEEFAAMVSHELKTPLIPISGYAELFLDGSMGNITPIQKEKLQIMYENSIRLTTLIQDILDARKIELGKLKLDIQSESVRNIAKRCIDIFRPISEQKGITLTNKTDDIIVTCDPDRVLQVFNNVVSNAMKFVPTQHGTISINSRVDDGSVVLSITDNGPGIPKEKQQSLFKRFYQVDKSLTRKSGGTGLGLAISRGIIESHGGKIWVESEENQGSTISFTLPLENSK